MTPGAESLGMSTHPAPTEPAVPATSPTELSPFARICLASLSAGAAVSHFAMIPAHAQESLGVAMGFALAGWFQLVFAVAVVARPSARWLRANVVANLVVLAGWAVSRTVGLPFGPEAWTPEPISAVDALCSTLEALMVVGSLVALRRPAFGAGVSRRGFVAATAVPALAVAALTTAALASPAAVHSHGDDRAMAGSHASAEHEHAGDEGMGAGTDHPDHADHDDADHDDHDGPDHDAGDAATEQSAGVHDHATMPGATDPLAASSHDQHGTGPTETSHEHGSTGATGMTDDSINHAGHHAECTAPVTPAQQAAADQLAAQTKAAMAKYEDFDVAMAEGWTHITPEGRPLVHYALDANLSDGRLLDPQRPESLIYAFDQKGRSYFVGAMFLNEDPSVAPPAPGGCLTQWHDHTNLCTAPGVGMVGVVAPDGSCPPGSTNETTTSMLHAWYIPMSNGQFVEADPAGVRQGVIDYYYAGRKP